MAIEDAISKRSVDGHQFSCDFMKINHKKDVYTLEQFKHAVKNDVLAALRDHCWGVSRNHAETVVVNIDVNSVRKGNGNIEVRQSRQNYVYEDFGRRFVALTEQRNSLERIIDVLHKELNLHTAPDQKRVPVKVQGCSAIEFMELLSQLSMTGREKLQFLPTPTDLLATRTLLPTLTSLQSLRCPSGAMTRNTNGSFACFISNAIFGTDGLNNLVSTHLEYGTGTLIHFVYEAADVVTHYALLGQVHRKFGSEPRSVIQSLYQQHIAYDGQVAFVDSKDEEATSHIKDSIRDPNVKAIIVNMGAPNLTAFLHEC